MKTVVNHYVDRNGEMKYRVRWYGFSASQDTWEPEHHLPREFVQRYWKKVTSANTEANAVLVSDREMQALTLYREGEPCVDAANVYFPRRDTRVSLPKGNPSRGLLEALQH